MNKINSIYVMLLLAAVFTFKSADAQEVRGGFKGGVTLSNLYIDLDDLDTENARWGFNAGFYSQIMFLETIGIQPEILFTTKGTEATYTGQINQTIDFRLNYIDIPLLLVFRPLDVLEFYAGPYVGFLLGSNIDFTGLIDGEEGLSRDNFNNFDYGVAAGLALNFRVIKLGLRYNLGMQEVANSTLANTLIGDSRHSYAQLYIAIGLSDRTDRVDRTRRW
jgi:hypothetical protein